MSHHCKSKLIRNILKFSESSGTDRLVHLVLAEYSDMANTSMSVPDLATLCRLSVRQAQRAVKNLLDQGYINRTAGNGRGHVASYHINVTPWHGPPEIKG
jgi:MarR-like DNA-binding transcriptional regulator SgrR of sgrS sRNA